MPKVSVIIPCYNAEKYIERCLNALETQTFQDFEVIVIDDCSSDQSVKIITEYATHTTLQIHLLKNETNSGPAASRNKGIGTAKGDYIAFCDSDDWYDSNFLSSMLSKMEGNCSDIVFCGYKVIDSNNNCELRPLHSSKEVVSSNEALVLDVDSLCMMMVKAQIIKRTPLPNIRNGEDMAVIPLLIGQSNCCSIVNDCLYNYYRNNYSASQTATMQAVDSLILSFEHIKENFSTENKEILEYIGIRNLLYAGIITLFSVSYNPKKAKEIIENFEKDFPSWYENKMIGNMPKYKRLVLKFTHRRCYVVLFFIALIRKMAIGN